MVCMSCMHHCLAPHDLEQMTIVPEGKNLTSMFSRVEAESHKIPTSSLVGVGKAYTFRFQQKHIITVQQRGSSKEPMVYIGRESTAKKEKGGHLYVDYGNSVALTTQELKLLAEDIAVLEAAAQAVTDRKYEGK